MDELMMESLWMMHFTYMNSNFQHSKNYNISKDDFIVGIL